MADRRTAAHIAAQAQIRGMVERAVIELWGSLPGYDKADVDEWVSKVVPVVTAAQAQGAAITEAYVAGFLEDTPLGIPIEDVTGAAVRNGADPADVYARPFVNVWTALSKGVDYADAVNAGMARAQATAAMDVQLSSRATFDAVQKATPRIYGFHRVADGGACKFCKKVDGAYVKSATAFALHNRCGCALEPLVDAHALAVFLPDGTRIRNHINGPRIDIPDTPTPEDVAIHEHGELGAVLLDAAHNFTAL